MTLRLKNKVRIFEVSSEGLFKVIGSNGCGKSVFLRYLYKKNKESISYLPQEIFLLENLSVLDNLEAFLGKSNLNSSELGYLLPADLSLKVNKLSGGEKRKVQLFIALSSDKNIIILDEPFNNIDKLTTHMLIEYIQDISLKKAILYVDHSELLVSQNLINAESEINYSCKGELEVKKSQSSHLKLKYYFSNLNLISKVYLIVGGIFLFTFIFAIASVNNLSTATNTFKNEDTKASVMSNICTGTDALGGPTTNSQLLANNEGIKVELSIPERIPLSRTFVDIHKNYMFSAIELENPKADLEAYDGELPFYDVSNFVFGSYPEDYSNQVAIPYFYARFITNNTNQDIEDIVGSEIEINNQKVVVSGVFRGIQRVKGNAVITAYQGEEQSCNPMLNGVKLVSSKEKLFRIIIAVVFGTFIYILVLTYFEFSFFRLLRSSKFSNKLILKLMLWSGIIMFIAIIYYFNFP